MTAFSPLQFLVGRRLRRGNWAYALWFIPYSFIAAYFAGTKAFHAATQPYQMLAVLLPVFVVAAQIVYPTLLAWAVIFIPSVAYCALGIYHLARHATERPPQSDNDLAGFVLGALFMGACLLVCVCLFFARPRRVRARIAEPGAAPNGGPAAAADSSGVTGGPPSVS
jgi:hypothetical protein